MTEIEQTVQKWNDHVASLGVRDMNTPPRTYAVTSDAFQKALSKALRDTS